MKNAQTFNIVECSRPENRKIKPNPSCFEQTKKTNPLKFEIFINPRCLFFRGKISIIFLATLNFEESEEHAGLTPDRREGSWHNLIKSFRISLQLNS